MAPEIGESFPPCKEESITPAPEIASLFFVNTETFIVVVWLGSIDDGSAERVTRGASGFARMHTACDVAPAVIAT